MTDYRDEDLKLDNEINNKEQKKESVLWDWIKSIIIAVVLALIIKTFIAEPTLVQGTSMNQTLENGDRVIVNKFLQKFREIERGDIIVMEYDTDHDYIKRIIGLPGETVQIIDGSTYINGQMLDETYAYGSYTDTINGFEWVLGEDQYFVMGDNRQPGGSTDSRVFGPIMQDRIRGIANFRFYPFDEVGGLE